MYGTFLDNTDKVSCVMLYEENVCFEVKREEEKEGRKEGGSKCR